jgi:hypothetical protein
MLVADTIYSPDDGGWYARIWTTETGATIATVPADDKTLSTRAALIRALRKEYGTIDVRDT